LVLSSIKITSNKRDGILKALAVDKNRSPRRENRPLFFLYF